MATVLTPAEIKQKIEDWITTNGNHEITGAHLNTILAAIMDYVGVGYALIGTAPASAPSPDVPSAYLAAPGTYTNYESGDTVIPEGSIAVLTYDGSAWSKSVIKVCDPVSILQNASTGQFDLQVGETTCKIGNGEDVLFNKEIITETNADKLHYTLENGFYYSGISESSNNNWRRCRIPLKDAKVLRFKTSIGGSANCCLTDKDLNILKTWVSSDLDGDYEVADLTAYAGAYYFYFCAYITNIPIEDIIIELYSQDAKQPDLIKLESYVTGNEPLFSPLSGGLILVNSAPTVTVSNVYSITDYIPVNEGDAIKVKAIVYSSGLVITGYASKDQSSYVSDFSVAGKSTTESAIEYNVVIPNGVNFIRVSTSNAGLVEGEIPIYRVLTDSVQQQLNDALGKQSALLDKPYLINVKGQLQSSGGTNYWCSDFIKLNESDTYKIKGVLGSSSALLVSFYSDDEQEDFIGRAILGNNAGTPYDITFVVPLNAKYVRFCSSYGVSGPHLLELEKVSDGRRIGVIENQLLSGHKTLLDFPRTSLRKPMILFQMDMADAAYGPTLLDYANILEANNVKKSAYCVLPKFLGASAYKNFDLWMNDIFYRGNEIALHTDDTYVFNHNSTMTDAQVDAAMNDYIDRMNAKGYDVTGFIPLGADLKQSFKSIIAKYMNWMLSGDGTIGNVKGDANLMDENVMDFINSLQTDRYAIMRIDLECMNEDASAEMHAAMLQRAKDVIDETISRVGFTIFYTHTYNVTSGTTYTLYPELFIPLCEYLKTKIDTRQVISGNTNELLEWYYTKRAGEQ